MWFTRLVFASIVGGGFFLAAASSSAQSMMQALPASTAMDTTAGWRLARRLVPDEINGEVCEFGGQPHPCDDCEIDLAVCYEPFRRGQETWQWQILPLGLIYRSYLADPLEPRFGSVWFHEVGQDWLWDIALGGRAGILRYGTPDPLWPEGFQIDIEGAAFPRLGLDYDRDLVSVDFRFGIPLTYRRGPWETKFGYYHLSSHLGDEFMLKNPHVDRVNYSRDTLVLGIGFRPHLATRFYAEAGWALYTDGGAEPWEFRFGFEYSPVRPASFRGAPFFAIGTHLREEVNFGGNLVVQTGWEWRGPTGRLFRVGLHYLNGKSNQYQFHDEHEEQIGLGTWFDF